MKMSKRRTPTGSSQAMPPPPVSHGDEVGVVGGAPAAGTQIPSAEGANDPQGRYGIGDTLRQIFDGDLADEDEIQIVRQDGHTMPYQEPTEEVAGQVVEKKVSIAFDICVKETV